MRKSIAVAALAAFAAAPALHAQSGLALKGSYVFNQSKISDARQSDFNQVPSPDGFSIGAEYVLPMGIGIGASAYTEGRATNVDARTTSFAVIGEANYFARLPMIPLRPYVGVHAGLGRYTIQDVSGGTTDGPRIEDSRTDLGYQLGVRWQVSQLLGIDGQYRHVSDASSDNQSPDLERNQFLLGITVF
jgi:opacity protein-like surface antigen